jgi:peptidoglycan hydrolase CwlO-like protein
MSIELTNEEKIAIAQQHMKSVMFAQYNAELSLKEARSVSTPNQANIDSVNAQLADISSQISTLQNEINSLQSTTPTSN